MKNMRLILPMWRKNKLPDRHVILEGSFSPQQLKKHNEDGYGIYYLPNHPKDIIKGTVDGTHIDVFNYVFVDMDLKDGKYLFKDSFIEAISESGIQPTKIVDSGNGIHAYWRVSNLDAMSYLRFQRRLANLYNTDIATTSLFQLMRLEGYNNTKKEDNIIPCIKLFEDKSVVYTPEELDKLLPPISVEDEKACKEHYNRVHNSTAESSIIDDSLPPKFGALLRDNEEVAKIFKSDVDDRSKADYRLAHIMFVEGFTAEEATRVLINSAKALQRSPVHRQTYATNIVAKVWTFEDAKDTVLDLSEGVDTILSRAGDDNESLKGKRFACKPYFDGTEHGFRLTQLIGLCAGVGVGKTAIGLNLFKGFVEKNPDYVHMFISLEQPAIEIADRWRKMCGTNTRMHSKVHILTNYNPDGSYRNLSLKQIQDYILRFQEHTGLKVGCICLDHIGILKKDNKPENHQGLRDICSQLKSFAVATKTLFVVQSQTSRDKAGDGDLELFKDAAYGTQDFESFVDYLIVAWQPLKKCYDNPQCPRVTAYKFAKVRFKSKNDILLEDQRYRLLFDQDTEVLRPMTQEEEAAFKWYDDKAIRIRGKDRKTDSVTYTSVRFEDLKEEASDEKHH